MQRKNKLPGRLVYIDSLLFPPERRRIGVARERKINVSRALISINSVGTGTGHSKQSKATRLHVRSALGSSNNTHILAS